MVRELGIQPLWHTTLIYQQRTLFAVDSVYGFTGEDPQLGRKFCTGRAYGRYGLPDTPLGNYAYRVGSHTPDEHQRAVDTYQRQFEKQSQDPSSEVYKSVERLSDRLVRGEKFVLTCWCPKNLPCHTRNVIQPAVIDRALEKLIQQSQFIEESKEIMKPNQEDQLSPSTVVATSWRVRSRARILTKEP